MTRRRSSRAKAARPAGQVALPLAPRLARRLIIGGIGALVIGVVTVWALVARLPERVAMAALDRASVAGFTIRHVEIHGARHLPRLAIYQEVLHGGSDSMWLTSLGAMRGRMQELPWVSDVRIERRWPDRIIVEVIERQPAALWQQQGQLYLIDREGEILPVDDLEPFADLPLLVGEAAGAQASSFLPMLDSYPELAGQMGAALWVGDRRWDLRMKSGETISLPEGEAAATALQRFADIERRTPLLGQGFLRFDLRIPDKMVVRVDKDPGQKLAPRQPPAAAQPGNAIGRIAEAGARQTAAPMLPATIRTERV